MTDTGVHYPPEYDTFQPPAVGASYADPVFGTKVTRVSDALATPNAADGGNLTWVTGEYSSINPFNSDKTRILLIHESYFGLYDGGGGYVGELPLEIHASTEPKWSKTDNRTIFYVHGNQLKSYNVATEESRLIRTFSEYSTIKGMGESDLSADGDHMVFAGDGRYVFVYRLSADRKSPVFDTAGKAFDSLYITPDNNVTVTWNQAGDARYNGIELFDGDRMQFQRQVTRAGGHMAICRDTDGSEVLIWANSGDPRPLCENGIIKVRLADGKQTCILALGWSPTGDHLAVHVSAPDNAGFAIVSTYAPSNPKQLGWGPFTNEILRVPLDGAATKRLVHHRSRPHNSYNWQPRAACSRDGSRIVFGSNFNLRPSAEYSDVYLMSEPPHIPPPAPDEPAPQPEPEPAPPPPPAPDHTLLETTVKRLDTLTAEMKAVRQELKAIKAAIKHPRSRG